MIVWPSDSGAGSNRRNGGTRWKTDTGDKEAGGMGVTNCEDTELDVERWRIWILRQYLCYFLFLSSVFPSGFFSFFLSLFLHSVLLSICFFLSIFACRAKHILFLCVFGNKPANNGACRRARFIRNLTETVFWEDFKKSWPADMKKVLLNDCRP